MNEVKIQWLGHSCFCMEYREYSIVTDPYEDGYVPGLAPLCLSAGAVYCSHGHGDHSAAACVKQTREKAPPDFSVQEFAVPHDHHGGARRGMNTIRQFCFGSLRAAHMGDTGCMPEESTLAALHGCDALLLPIGGCAVPGQAPYPPVPRILRQRPGRLSARQPVTAGRQTRRQGLFPDCGRRGLRL